MGLVEGVKDSSGDSFDDWTRRTTTRGAQGSLYGAVIGVKGEGWRRGLGAHCRVS